MPPEYTKRYLGIDVSLTCTGFAVIDVKNRKPTLITTQPARTLTSFSDGQRYSFIEAITGSIAHNYGDFEGGIIREDFTDGRSKRARQGVFGAWAAVDIGLARYSQKVTAMVSPTTVKKVVAGDGKADKAAVEVGVRKILRLKPDYVFQTDDESDACAIVLSYLINENLIENGA